MSHYAVLTLRVVLSVKSIGSSGKVLNDGNALEEQVAVGSLQHGELASHGLLLQFLVVSHDDLCIVNLKQVESHLHQGGEDVDIGVVVKFLGYEKIVLPFLLD